MFQQNPVRDYGYCGYACMEAHKPEAFGGDLDSPMPEQESPAEFTRRLCAELKKEKSK